MYCYQCQETARNTGCTISGVCGKKSTTAANMDMLLFAIRGVAIAAHQLHNNKIPIPPITHHAIADGLFSTITNANFDELAIISKTKRMFSLRNEIIQIAHQNRVALPMVDEITWDGPSSKYAEKALEVGVLREDNEDLRSLKELILYGIKGMAAYVEHARNLGFEDTEINFFIIQTLSELTLRKPVIKHLMDLTLKTGAMGVRAMALLDKASTDRFGHPIMTEVKTSVGYRPGILVSGHDLADLEMLLEQTERQGVDVYTHGEMLPAHYYPRLKKYPHLVGNYGGAWWKQKEEFDLFHGPILFTSNCIVPPLSGNGYESRIFTTNSAGYPGCPYIASDKNGKKDFSPIIQLAKKCPPPDPVPPSDNVERETILGGFAHRQIELVVDHIVGAVIRKKIRGFVVMAGCDGRMRNREYYTEFAKRLPEDVIILTAGCAKYRYNCLDLGEIDGIPRMLDAGQCNDCYSLVLTAIKLKDALGLKNLNELPILYNIAWYEQKAVIVLLALLSQGICNIRLGPTLPAFLSPGVLNVLKEKFKIGTITTVEKDLEDMMKTLH